MTKSSFNAKIVEILKSLYPETFFSIFAVIVVLCLTNQLWFSFVPLEKELILDEKNDASYSMFFARIPTLQNGTPFGKVAVNAKDIYEYDVSADFSKKSSRLDLNIEKNDDTKKALRSFSNFTKVSEDEYSTNKQHIFVDISTNVIEIKSFEKSVFFVYEKPFKFYMNVKFNTSLFVIIAFFSYVFFYMTLSYIFRLKRFGHNPLHDILFVAAFAIMLCIPLSGTEKASVSHTENRTLAKFPQIFVQDRFNNKWGKEFEQYFNDRFFGREQLNVLYKSFSEIFSSVYQNNEVIVDKRKGVFTYKDAIKYLFRTPSQKELEDAKNSLNKLAALAASQNTKVYVIVIPDRANIYREDLPFHKLDGLKTFGEIFDEYLAGCDNLDFVYIYPKKELLAAKIEHKDELYFKTDAHQTDYGGYISYLALMNTINRDFPKLKTVTLSEYDIKKDKKILSSENLGYGVGNTNKASLNSAKYLNTEYTYYLPKKTTPLVIKPYDDPELNLSKAYYPQGENRVMLLGSSYIEKLYIYLRQTFKYTDKIRVNNSYEQNFHVSRFEKRIVEERPDVLVIAVNESEAFQYIQTMYDNSKEVDW